MSSREMATVLIAKHIEARIAISWRSTSYKLLSIQLSTWNALFSKEDCHVVAFYRLTYLYGRKMQLLAMTVVTRSLRPFPEA